MEVRKEESYMSKKTRLRYRSIEPKRQEASQPLIAREETRRAHTFNISDETQNGQTK